jgi:predicted MFS family arabinose efflux permease
VQTILLFLGLVDIAAGFALVLPNVFGFLAASVGALLLLKGSSSIVGSFLAGYYFDFLGWIDLLAAAAIFLGWSIPLLWLLLFIKGAWSMLFAMMK